MSNNKRARFLLSPAEWAAVIAIVAVLVLVLLPDVERVRSVAYRMVCGTNMDGLGKAMLIYASDNNDVFPAPENWCDLLVAHADVPPKQFRCRADKVGPGSYAMNARCYVNSPNDVVMLFESKPGWNQHGGLGLLNMENHRGDGCHIVLRNCSCRFVKTDDVSKLNWGSEPNAE